MKYEEVRQKIRPYKVSKEYFEKNYKDFVKNYPGYYNQNGKKILTPGEDGILRAFEILYTRGELPYEEIKKKVDKDGDTGRDNKSAKTKDKGKSKRSWRNDTRQESTVDSN